MTYSRHTTYNYIKSEPYEITWMKGIFANSTCFTLREYSLSVAEGTAI